MAKAKTTEKATSKTTRRATGTETAKKSGPKKASKKAAATTAARSAAAKAKPTKAKPVGTRAKSAVAKAKSSKTAAARKKTADDKVTIDRRGEADQRGTKTDRRKKSEPVAVERRTFERRAKVNRRRQIDPTTCERDYTSEELEFMSAMDDYKRTSGRMFPTCSEVLEVIRGLGYGKLSATDEEADEQPAVAEDSQASVALTAEQSGEQADPAAIGPKRDWHAEASLMQTVGSMPKMSAARMSDSLIDIAGDEDLVDSAGVPVSLGLEDCDVNERVTF